MINPNTLKPFGKFCVTLGMIPSSYKASLTYEEQLLWFCNYLETKVIPAINNNAEALQEVQALYEELRQFVVDYFAHLDVQDEIDNKLDEMVEDGTLANIINQEIFDELNTKVNTIYDNYLNKNSVGFAQDSSYPITLGQPIYVDYENGSDSNNGLTTETPFKTIKGLIDFYSKQINPNLNIYLKGGQIHDFPYYNILNMCLHFNQYGNTVEPAIINFSYNSNIAFYNCHLNFHGTDTKPLKITGSRWYMDGGSYVMTYTTLENQFGGYGASGSFTNCDLSKSLLNLRYCSSQFYYTKLCNVQAFNVNFTFRNCTFTTEFRDNSWDCILDLIGCTTLVFGTSYIDLTNPIILGSLFKVRGGSFNLDINLTPFNYDNDKFKYAVSLYTAPLYINSNRYRDLTGYSTDRVELNDTDASFVSCKLQRISELLLL